jgi:hypothetical protein
MRSLQLPRRTMAARFMWHTRPIEVQDFRCPVMPPPCHRAEHPARPSLCGLVLVSCAEVSAEGQSITPVSPSFDV